jgi:hypothetical protein
MPAARAPSTRVGTFRWPQMGTFTWPQTGEPEADGGGPGHPAGRGRRPGRRAGARARLPGAGWHRKAGPGRRDRARWAGSTGLHRDHEAGNRMIPGVRAYSTRSIAIGRYRTTGQIARTPGPSAQPGLPTQDGDSTPAGACVRHYPIGCLPFRHDVRGASSAASNDASPPSPTTPPHDHQIDDIDRARRVEPASDPRQAAHEQCQLPCELTCSPLWRSRGMLVVLVSSPPRYRRPPPPSGRGSQCARTPARRRRR